MSNYRKYADIQQETWRECDIMAHILTFTPIQSGSKWRRLSGSKEQNRAAWNERARRELAHTEMAGGEQFRDPWKYIDDCGWLGREVKGKRVLCLAAGGGWHGPLFASAGALVTVVDISPEMLARDKAVAAAHRLTMRLLELSMDDLGGLQEGEFELVIQPVSTCYLPDINRVYREVARVTAAGGIYISQHKQPANLQAETISTRGGYAVTEAYYRSGALPSALEGAIHRESGTLEYLHRWDDLLGGLCRSGFVIEDVAEPRHGDGGAQPGTFRHRSWYIPPYITLKARRTTTTARKTATVWTPR
jgi:SAM-dependent methyltransferase